MGQGFGRATGNLVGYDSNAASLVGDADEPDHHSGPGPLLTAGSGAVGSALGLGAGAVRDSAGSPPAIEEFPPLGGLDSTELGQDRHVNTFRNAANNGASSKPQGQEVSLNLRLTELFANALAGSA